jgi:hypothetical protein
MLTHRKTSTLPPASGKKVPKWAHELRIYERPSKQTPGPMDQALETAERLLQAYQDAIKRCEGGRAAKDNAELFQRIQGLLLNLIRSGCSYDGYPLVAGCIARLRATEVKP